MVLGFGEDLVGATTSHVVGSVAASGVVVLDPGLEPSIEAVDAGEELPVERHSEELVQHGAVESFTHRVVVVAWAV